ncbi:retrovirus-related pol polyprotein from transposon TNT 1-94 [Tanacetum coccineum]|uniref:Retrovirus-related pol polyprotein from transposon TNT 1-94 n=1 Tax=Tanacetum coccineum TaxID=301880 RepID=A0ABQ4Z9L1_9ASTR
MPSQQYQSHQTSSVPPIAYNTPQFLTQPLIEFPNMDSCLVVPVFNQGDDPIACLNKAMAFLIAIASSSRVSMQQVQGRQGQSYAGNSYKGNATSSGGNNARGQARVVKCYNCQGEGHMARQCTQLKRPKNAAYPGIPDGQAAQTTIPNNVAFQTEDLDAYDSDCDDVSNAKVVLMANLSNYDSDVISEVPHFEPYHTDMDNQSVHAMQSFEQIPVVDFTDNEITNFGKRFVPQQELSDKQALWLQTSHPNTDQFASSPIKIEAPRELPKGSNATDVPSSFCLTNDRLSRLFSGSELGSELTLLAGSELNASELDTSVLKTSEYRFSKIFILASYEQELSTCKQELCPFNFLPASCQVSSSELHPGKENGVNILKSFDEGPFQMGTFRETLAEGNEGALHLGLSLTDNLIEKLTNTLALLTQSYKTYLLQTNNQLRNSSNPKNQATVQDGGVVVQNVQGRQNRGQGQARQVKCYNFNGIGHIGKNCTQPKRPQNSEYFKDKMLLMQAQDNGVALDEEQLLFITGGQDNAIDEDVDEQPVQDLALNVDNVFQADDCDAFDYDVDEAPIAQTMFMANLSSTDHVYDKAGPSYDSDVLSEVHDNDHYQDVVCEHHEIHERHDDVQPNYVVDLHVDYTSDSNMILYDQYIKDNIVPVIQNNVSSVPNDAYMMILNDMHEPPA